jgi:putative cell wall-binding protein
VSRRTRRASLLGAFTSLALVGAALIAAPASAGADEVPTPDPGSDRVVMGDYPVELYAEQAEQTPPELAEALQADLGITPEQYYAEADAAATAVDVVDELSASGVEVLSSRVDGTELVVNVASDADVAAVEAVGATAEVGGEAVAPAERKVVDGAPDVQLLRDVVGGQGYYTRKGDLGYLCSVGFNGIDINTSNPEFLTAGHCVEPGSDDGGRAYFLEQSRPGQDPATNNVPLGYPNGGSVYFGNYYDTALFHVDSTVTPKPVVGTWNNNQGSVTSGTPVAVRDYTRAIVGQSICKSGRTTGWTCGTVEGVDEEWIVGGHYINAFHSGMCALHGDSGGAVVSGSYALGLLSFGSYQDSCNEANQITGVFPIDSPLEDSLDVETTWEPLVTLAKPDSATLGGGAPLYTGTAATGTVLGGGKRYSVHLSIDGGAETVLQVASNGSWSAPSTSALGAGSHSFSMYASYKSGIQTSATVSGSFTVADPPTVERISGATRFDVAVQIANRMYPTTAPVVYVATGYNYPDALSAGPAAVKQGGPLLLTLTDAVPDVVAAKIQSLAPERIVIVGGPNSVNDSVKSILQGLAPQATVERLSGADRYAASRAVVDYAFDEATHAYVATGGNFPDALSAGGAAGSKDQPVVLVNGGAPAADKPTVDLFKALDTTSLTVVGGVNSVSPAVENSLRTGIPASVDRVAGADRFQASIALNRQAFQTAGTVYLATGYNFPDALAGGVLAGKTDGPLYVVPTECVPRGVLTDITSLGAGNVVLLGGPNSLSPAVQSLTPCAW